MSNLVISSLKTAAVKPSHGDQDLLLFLPWEHTFHTWAGAFRRRLWTCQLQKEKGPIIIIILSGNRQELGEAPRVSTPESPQRSTHADHLTMLFVETTLGGKLQVISIKLLVTQGRANIHVHLLWVVLARSHLHKSTLPYQVVEVLDDC